MTRSHRELLSVVLIETGHLQRVVVDGLDLVRERVHLAHTDGQHRVELMGQPDAVGLDEEEELLEIAAEGGRVLLDVLNLGELILREL